MQVPAMWVGSVDTTALFFVTFSDLLQVRASTQGNVFGDGWSRVFTGWMPRIKKRVDNRESESNLDQIYCITVSTTYCLRLNFAIIDRCRYVLQSVLPFVL